MKRKRVGRLAAKIDLPTQRLILGAYLPTVPRAYGGSVRSMTIKAVLWTVAALEFVPVTRRQLADAVGCGLLTLDRALLVLEIWRMVTVTRPYPNSGRGVYAVNREALERAVDTAGLELMLTVEQHLATTETMPCQ